MPVIQAAQKVEIVGPKFKASQAKCQQDSVSKTGWVWWYTSIIFATWEVKLGRLQSRTYLSKNSRFYLKQKLTKSKSWGVTQEVDLASVQAPVLSKKKKKANWERSDTEPLQVTCERSQVKCVQEE
jgi:hypothetical protein